MSHTIRRRRTHKAHHHRHRHRPDRAEQPQQPPRACCKDTPGAKVVTDHAVLRWLERVVGIDVAAQVREAILADGRDQLIEEVGQGRIRIADTNAVLEIVAGRVVTVTTRGGQGG